MQTRPSFTYLSVLALVLASIALGACGDSNDDSSSTESSAPATTEQTTSTAAGGGSASLKIDAIEKGPEQLGFSKKSLSAKGGDVTIAMDNPQGNQLPHAIEIEGNGVEEEGQTVSAGGTSTVSANLKPGKYDFYCPVGDHRDEGMEGTLTVN
jgi:plastocyanin